MVRRVSSTGTCNKRLEWPTNSPAITLQELNVFLAIFFLDNAAYIRQVLIGRNDGTSFYKDPGDPILRRLDIKAERDNTRHVRGMNQNRRINRQVTKGRWTVDLYTR